MDKNRREFLKLSGLAAGAALIPSAGLNAAPQQQRFNMSGYAAPAIPTVRIAFFGVGNRGSAAVERMSFIEGVKIQAICDVQPEKAAAAKARIKSPGHPAQLYTAGPDDWKKVCQREDIDLVYIATPWSLHTPMAVYAMEHGKHAATEIPAATTVEDCRKLVATSERTRKHCVMLENCCYDFFELLTLNMARQGFFGEIVHTEGAYIHDIFESMFDRSKRYDVWRLRENAKRNGNLYPTHGFGPICQVMNINRGDQLDYLTSMSSNDFMMGQKAKELASHDAFYKPFAGAHFRGNMNTSTIRTKQGRTIMLQHDVTSPRPYSRLHLISGTKATAQKYPEPGRISTSHEGWLSEAEFKQLEEKYTPPISRKLGDLAKQIGGHGGMDFLMDWRLIDCLRNGLPMDMDVYDAASWSVVGPLSEWSVAHRSAPIDVPDFTAGAWKNNKPVDLSLSKGGTTGVISVANKTTNQY
ncbi:Gfo/Idh/MocA family oxidoreductase [Chitinophaga lutea]